MSLDLIKNRPQFDLEVLQPGVAIKYKYGNKPFDTFTNAIIIESELEGLRLVEYSGYYMKDDVWIYLKDAVEGNVIIEILK